MDDIKGPAPRSAPPAKQRPVQQPSVEQEPESEMPIHEEPEYQEEAKGGMKTWLVILLVVLALVIGAGGVYLWQTSSSTSDETEALQSQIDQLNQDLTDAETAAAANTLEEKDKEIQTLTDENTVLTESNTALQTRNTELTTNCADANLDADCLPIIP